MTTMTNEKPAVKTSSSKQKTYPEVHGRVSMPLPPVCPNHLFPRGFSGELKITGENGNEKKYLIVCLSAKVAATGGHVLTGWRLIQDGEADNYDIPVTLDDCCCKDYLTRQRPGGCRHLRAVRKLVEKGVLATQGDDERDGVA